MRNHEVTQRHQLLDLNGRLMEPGWSKDLVQVYDRRAIKAPKFRIKEWDYYLVLSDQFACAFTLSDDGYIGLQSVSLLDFTKPWEHTETILNAFPMGKMKMPSTSAKGNVVYRDKRLAMEFIRLEISLHRLTAAAGITVRVRPWQSERINRYDMTDTMILAALLLILATGYLQTAQRNFR